MESDELYSVENAWEIAGLKILSMVLHTMSNRVSALRNYVHALELDGRIRDSRITSEIHSISQIADELASDIRRISLIYPDTSLAGCYFLQDVLQPAVDLTYRKTSRFKLFVDPSFREAPQVQLRPSLAIQALLRLILATDPKQVRCSAEGGEDYILFSLTLHPVAHQVPPEMQERLSYLLNKAGVIAAEPSHASNTYSIRLKLKAG